MIKSNIDSVLNQLESRYDHLAKIKDALDLESKTAMYGEYREYYMLKKRIVDFEKPAIKPGLVKVEGENAGAIIALNRLTMDIDDTKSKLANIMASMYGDVQISGNRQYDEDRHKRSQALDEVDHELPNVVKALVALRDIEDRLKGLSEEDLLPRNKKYSGLFREIFRVPDKLEFIRLEFSASTYRSSYNIDVMRHYYRNGREDYGSMYTSDIRKK